MKFTDLKNRTWGACIGILVALFVGVQLMQCLDHSVSNTEDSEIDSFEDSIMVKITNQAPDSLQLNPFDLNAIEINGDTLTLSITHGGGCKAHSYALFMTPAAFLESNPVQANLYPQHNSNGDLCKALIHKNLSFNLSPIMILYEEFYHKRDTIIINVYEYFVDEPNEKLSVIYAP